MKIQEIAKKIETCGGRLYLVGGAVRDELLKEEPIDRDYCVTGLAKSEFEALFPEAHIRGKDFPVYDIEGTEFALARRERRQGEKHTDFEVVTGKSITMEEDLKRRDITINSMAIDVLTNEVIDPYNGIYDLKHQLIRATSAAFPEDALRVYRVARFAARFRFQVEENTIKQMKFMREDLQYISAERVMEELKKVLGLEKPSIFFQVLKNAECLSVHFKEIADLIGVEQPSRYHPEGDAFSHTMEAVDRACEQTKQEEIRFAALVHDLGKAATPKDKWPHHYGHDLAGIPLVKDLCRRIKAPKSWEKCGVVAAREHMRGGRYQEMKPSTKVDFLEQNAKTYLGLEGLEIVINADRGQRGLPIRFAKQGEEILQRVSGKDFPEITDYKKMKEKIRNQRIQLMKEMEEKKEDVK